jgi:hypothetical protein
MSYDMVNDMLSLVRQPALVRLNELMDRVRAVDLTTPEILAMVAVLESADERVNAHPAPVLELVPS